MGQQQLLILLLATLLVGIATVFAINVFSSQTTFSNRNSVYQDLLTAASYVQTIWEKPEFMGGASKKFQKNMTDEEFLQFLNVPASEYQSGDSKATNANGTYLIV